MNSITNSIPSAIRSSSSGMRWTSWGCNILFNVAKTQGRETEAENVGTAFRPCKYDLQLFSVN